MISSHLQLSSNCNIVGSAFRSPPRPCSWILPSGRVCLLTLITTSTSAFTTLARPLISISRHMSLSFRLRQTINHSQQKYSSVLTFPLSFASRFLHDCSSSHISNSSKASALIQKIILPRNNYTIFQRIHTSCIHVQVIKKVKVTTRIAFVANRQRIEVANNIPSRQGCVNFCSTGSKHFCSIEEVAPWMNPLNERSRPPFRPRTRRKDSPSPDNNRSSSFSLVIVKYVWRTWRWPAFLRPRASAWRSPFLWSINKISPAWDINPETLTLFDQHQ